MRDATLRFVGPDGDGVDEWHCLSCGGRFSMRYAGNGYASTPKHCPCCGVRIVAVLCAITPGNWPGVRGWKRKARERGYTGPFPTPNARIDDMHVDIRVHERLVGDSYEYVARQHMDGRVQRAAAWLRSVLAQGPRDGDGDTDEACEFTKIEIFVRPLTGGRRLHKTIELTTMQST